MYTPIKSFLNVDTWHTSHPLDKNRFYIALSQIIDSSDFSSQKLRTFMLAEKNLLDEDYENSFVKEIDNLTREAETIHSYKKAISI